MTVNVMNLPYFHCQTVCTTVLPSLMSFLHFCSFLRTRSKRGSQCWTFPCERSCGTSFHTSVGIDYLWILIDKLWMWIRFFFLQCSDFRVAVFNHTLNRTRSDDRLRAFFYLLSIFSGLNQPQRDTFET